VRDYTTLNRCCQDASASKIGQSEEILRDVVADFGAATERRGKTECAPQESVKNGKIAQKGFSNKHFPPICCAQQLRIRPVPRPAQLDIFHVVFTLQRRVW
jgi:hypothetical protein